jgi:hypothetical protein
MRLIDEAVSSGGGEQKAALSPRAPGRWRLRWSAQVCFALLERLRTQHFTKIVTTVVSIAVD